MATGCHTHNFLFKDPWRQKKNKTFTTTNSLRPRDKRTSIWGMRQKSWFLKTYSTFLSLCPPDIFLQENQSVFPSLFATLTRVCINRVQGIRQPFFSISSVLCYGKGRTLLFKISVSHGHLSTSRDLILEGSWEGGTTSAFWDLTLTGLCLAWHNRDGFK